MRLHYTIFFSIITVVIKMQMNVQETVVGTVDEIVYTNQENGFTVIVLDVDNFPLTVVGILPNVSEGEELEVQGYYTTHPNFGKQFRALFYSQRLPATSHAIKKYLASGTIKGIGPALARRIVDKFGENTFKIIETQPQMLTQVRGISENLANKISDEFVRVYGVRTVMATLKGYGLTPAESVCVYKTLGGQTLELIRHNPYILTRPEIKIEFKRVDEIAFMLGFSANNELRLKAGCIYVLNHNFVFSGHSCLPYGQLIRIATEFLKERESAVEIALSNAIEEGLLIHSIIGEGDGYVYLPSAYNAEKYVAKRIAEFVKMSKLRPKRDWDYEIQNLNFKNRVLYDNLQVRAINRALNDGFLILSGGPGTGKTTTLNAIISLYEKEGFSVAIAAPTGRAAKRVSEVTGYDAKTIHRLLEVQFDRDDNLYFVHNEKSPLKADVVIVDEFSMVDLMLFEALLRALKPTTRLILVGDANQLPSVACGCLLSDFMKCENLPVVELAQIFRQAAKSLIVTNAHDIVMGDMPKLDKRDRDFFFLNEFDRYRAQRTVLSLVCERLPKKYGYSPTCDIQVLCPSKQGELGTMALNVLLQEKINPPDKEKRQIVFGNVTFREGDKIMQNKNNYQIEWMRDDGVDGKGIFNGDIGEIEGIDKLNSIMSIRFEDKLCRYNFDMLNEIDHAYAVTVHKSQGSEFEAVILPLMGRHKNLHYRKLLYTAVTRAKKLLIIVGEESTVREMVKNNRKNLRYSTLSFYLKEELKGNNHTEMDTRDRNN